MACTLDSKRLPRWGRQWRGLGEQPNEEQAHSLDPKEPELQPRPWARSSRHPWRPFYALCTMAGKKGEHLGPRGAPATGKAALDGNPGTQAGMLVRGGAGARGSRSSELPSDLSSITQQAAAQAGAEPGRRALDHCSRHTPQHWKAPYARTASSQSLPDSGAVSGPHAAHVRSSPSSAGQTSASVRSLENTELSQWQKPKDLLTTSQGRSTDHLRFPS